MLHFFFLRLCLRGVIALPNGLCSCALSNYPLSSPSLPDAVGVRTLSSKERGEEITLLVSPKVPAPCGPYRHNQLGPSFLRRGTTVLASENSFQAREKVEKIQVVAPLALGKSKNTGSCLDPAAEPLSLTSVRAATTTLPSLGCCLDPSLGEAVVGVIWSFALRPSSLSGTCFLQSCH